jgi:hypothetical protein
MADKKSNDERASNDLVPVFMPPLAMLLAHAEKSKGARITESEVMRIRDDAACIMMDAGDAERMTESRGFRDVQPDNCWSDWHRLRVQFTGNGCLPKLILCVLGDADLESRCGQMLRAEGIEHEWSEHGDRMTPAFKASACRCDPSLTADDFASLAKHSRVLYVVSKNFTAQDAPSVSSAFLHLGRRLLEAGGLAMKCESSGVAHGRTRWLELARETDGADIWSALLRAYVQLPIQSGDDYHTCGLHLLGQPDLIASGTMLRKAYGSNEDPAWKAVDLFRVFAHYLLSECTPGHFGSGHTFSPDAASPRFRVHWEECTGYEEDDFFFNPFGRWRFAELVR